MIILIILTGVFLLARRYVRTVAEDSAETLADNLLRQADNSLSIYEDMLRYNAAYLCRYPIVDKLGKGTLLKGSSEEAQLSSYFSQITLKNGEIRSAILFDTDMNQIASFGKEIAFPEKQNYLRYEEDLNADYYYDDSEDFFYAFYYPIYNTLNGQGELAGMCVFILDRWTLDGTIRSLIGMNSAAILISDSNHLNLSWYTGGTLSDTEAMEVLRTDTDVIYKEGDWQNGI
jgi:two-component system sensor histidine kinase YesM